VAVDDRRRHLGWLAEEKRYNEAVDVLARAKRRTTL
jgi:hypothetical protein